MREKEHATLLREYLSHVYRLELSLQTQRLLCEKLREEMRKLNHYEVEPLQALKQRRGAGELIGMGLVGLIISIGAGSMLGLLIRLFEAVFSDFGMPLLNWGQLSLICIPLTSLLWIWLLASEALYWQEENERIRKQNGKIQTRNARRKFLKDIKIQIIGQEIEVLGVNCKSTARLLGCYYQQNLIRKKYRNLIAVSSFHQYFLSGQCQRLEGPEGAYALFESELACGHVDEVIGRQNMIQAVEKIFCEVLRMANNFQNLEENACVTAFNGSIAAQNTEFEKWIESVRQASNEHVEQDNASDGSTLTAILSENGPT
ncbi:hypothetical protein AGATL06_22850 [Agathobaculum sp. TL06]